MRLGALDSSTETFLKTFLRFRKAPASDRFGEVGGVLVLAKGGFGFNAVDVAAGGGKHGFDVAAVLFVIDGGEALPYGTVFDFVGDAFEDDGFVGLVCADGAIHVSSNVSCFARFWAGTKPEGIFPPDSPNQH